MFKQFQEPTINHLIYKTSFELINNPDTEVLSRNGHIVELQYIRLILENPKNRHLYLKGRKNNIYATIYETFWVIAGRDEILTLSKVLKRAPQFSDDGVKWFGAYGPRLYRANQIASIIEHIVRDINTRRATLAIWQPDLDTVTSLQQRIGKEYDFKDIPCSQWLSFKVIDNKFYTHFVQRSGDNIWGVSNINIFEFTYLQEIVREGIQLFIGNRVPLGKFIHDIDSLHAYDFTFNQVKDVNEENNYEELFIKETKPLNLPILNGVIDSITYQNKIREFHNKIYENWQNLNDTKVFKDFMALIDIMKEGQFKDYVVAVTIYLLNKNNLSIPNQLLYYVKDFSEDFRYALKANKFTPKILKEIL